MNGGRGRGKSKSRPGLKSGSFLQLSGQRVLSSPWPDKLYANEKLFSRLPARVRPLSKEEDRRKGKKKNPPSPPPKNPKAN